jgi:hypothetical protein
VEIEPKQKGKINKPTIRIVLKEILTQPTCANGARIHATNETSMAACLNDSFEVSDRGPLRADRSAVMGIVAGRRFRIDVERHRASAN